ncbi:PTS transporter subunit IIC [Shouchella patagoniensis]|uniref:PTS transporter subunit IIC n=1 Tax=Shouchella patagoniensis TaxID=228576 RepID=UPI000995862B|nr:PTS sugar transporter subunit IIC [Shouchella patagoniensis]
MESNMKDYMISRMYKASAGIANAVLVTLGIGLLFESFGNILGFGALVTIGEVTKVLLAPAIGAGIAYQLGGNTLVIYSAMAASTVGGAAIQVVDGLYTIAPGQPVSAVIAAVAATYVGKRVAGKTKLDMMAIPFSAVFVGGLVGVLMAAITTPMLEWMSGQLALSVQGSPIIAPMVIALVWSVLLMTPASSAALAIALQMDPISSAAALIGCTAQFVGFTLMSWKQNDAGALIAQGLVTPKVQFPNLIKNPRLCIPPFIAALVCAPLGTLWFNFQVSYELAGLGLNSLIAPITIFSTQGATGLLIFIGVGVILPGIISLLLFQLLKRASWTKTGDLHIEVQ